MVEGDLYAFHKPVNCLSQFINNQRRKKKLLSDFYDFPGGSMAIGRLDAKTEGLLLVTTNGKFSQLVRSKKVEKEYWVQVDGVVTKDALDELQKGVEISVEGELYVAQPCRAELHDELHCIPENPRGERSSNHGPMTWIKIVLREGKFRQVRKMTAVIGHPTIRLIRWRIGCLTLGELKSGEVKKISKSDI